MTEKGQVVLSLRGVSRSFGSLENETLALKRVDLTVREGEFVAIVGPSGAGKSTLLNILGLLDEPSGGRYLLAGTDVSQIGERERNRLRNEKIGFVFQSSHMLLGESASSNAVLPLKVRGTDVRQRAAQVRHALDRLGLAHRANEPAINLSGGEKQRVAIARAVASNPAVLLADEPTGALDSTNSELVIEHLQSLNAQGVTIVVITHDPNVASAAQRQVRIVDGVLEDEDRSLKAAPGREANVEGQLAGRRTTKLVDEALDALASHTSRPARALLLLAAFVLGAGGLVCAAGISQSASAQVADRLTTASLDEVVVRATAPAAYGEGFYKSGDGSAAGALAQLEGVELVGFVGGIPSAEAKLSGLPPRLPQSGLGGAVTVADGNYLSLIGAEVSPSHASSLLDNSWSGRVALVGEDVAKQLHLPAAGVGATLWLAGSAVDVVGVIENGGRDSALTNAVVVSAAAAAAANLTPEDPKIVVRTEPGYPAAIAEAAPLAIAPSDLASVRTSTVADLRNLQIGVATDLGSLVGIVSALLLALASLSSAVAMYLSVQTRASEIALRRAVGASRSSIWRMFTLEGLIIGLAGGMAGGALGLGAVIVVCSVQGWTPTLDFSLLGVGILAGSASGVLSATYPAIAAANANPALAIRG